MADIKEILSNMTTDEKIGQLLQHNAMFFSNSSAEITGPLEKMCIDEKVLETYGIKRTEITDVIIKSDNMTKSLVILM